MEPRAYESDAAGTPPVFPQTASLGYPNTATTTISATQPGAWWFYMIGEEVRNAIIAGGLTPNPYDSTQLFQAINNLRAGV